MIATALTTLVFAASAQATVMTLGSPLAGSFEEITTCGLASVCTFVQTSLTAPGTTVISPVDGVIIRWRIKGRTNEPGYALRVLQPHPGFNFHWRGYCQTW
jgi:hypothetical protein